MEQADPRGVRAWLDAELDASGVPRRLPVAFWAECLGGLVSAGAAGALEGSLRERVLGWVRAWLRFSRPDGSAVFGVVPPGVDPEVRKAFRAWAEAAGDPAIARVVDWWFPRRRSGPTAAGAPPLPAYGGEERLLAMLRADWRKPGEWLAVDGREPGPACRLELFAEGRRWLGPTWDSAEDEASGARARPVRAHSDYQADLAEWCFRRAGARVTRTTLMLRGRRLALLAEQFDGTGGAASWRLGIDPGLTARPLAGSAAIRLEAGRQGPSALVVPLGLPAEGGGERGALDLEGQTLGLRSDSPGRSRWLPLLISWDQDRPNRGVRWRLLTVAERSKPCPSDRAFAAWVDLGDVALVVYRSLGPPALRSVLGHQTSARFLVGQFTTGGDLKPWITIDS